MNLEPLKQLISDSGDILITSHIGPDGDSIGSSLGLYLILKNNYPNKTISIAMEEAAPSLAFLAGYDQIVFEPLSQAMDRLRPQLIIMLDTAKLGRATRQLEEAKTRIQQFNTKIAVIDHHEPADKDANDVYINNNSPAVSQDIYEIFIGQFKLTKPDGYAQPLMLGLYTDTGGFVHKNERFRDSLRVASELIADGADLEIIENKLNQISQAALPILAELVTNTASIGDCTYTYLGDEFVSAHRGQAEFKENMRAAVDTYKDNYLRSINGRVWGFLVYPDLLAAENTYSISFRALSDTVDVASLAGKLGGGGHRPAAGAKIVASSVDEALAQVKTVVENRNS